MLGIDAATCFACGLFMVVAARPFGQLAICRRRFSFTRGCRCSPIAAFIAGVGARASRSFTAIAAVIAGNLGWSAASIWLLLSGAIAPTALGDLFIAVQAVVVLALTACEVRGALRLAPGVGVRPSKTRSGLMGL